MTETQHVPALSEAAAGLGISYAHGSGPDSGSDKAVDGDTDNGSDGGGSGSGFGNGSDNGSGNGTGNGSDKAVDGGTDNRSDSGPDETPATDDRDPAQVLTTMVGHVLALAETWTDWDGRPVPAGDRLYTPHKAIRRVADHMVDHLAEMEARLAGEETQPDRWHASASTTAADLAPFTGADLDEARSRLTRLARIWATRLDALTPDELDRSPGAGWTFRQLAFHVAESVYYADSVGDRHAPSRPMNSRAATGLTSTAS
ncbi:hypothetical protein [Streptomyces sp. NPDC056323]|uniref:hypothetical protein n=1 Tax=Streptomyces sp. NPDC056323 TaxID=3345784 RepID=UPI0035D862F1